MRVTYPEWVGDESSYRAAAEVDTLCRLASPSTWQDIASADRALHASGWPSEHRLATHGGKPIGHASFRFLPTACDGDVSVARVSVLPDHRRLGVGRALHGLIQDATRLRGGRRLLSYVGGSKPAGLQFADALGYREVGRSIESEIDLRNVSPEPIPEVPGICVVAVSELRVTHMDWFDRLGRLFNAVEADTPFPIDEVPTPIDVFRARSIDADTAQPEAFLVAIDGDEWVGFTEVRRITGDPTRWSQELTGVVRSHRGRGIARALKSMSLEHPRRSGIATVRTWNDATNMAILEINRQLGFAPRQIVHQMLKTLTDR